MSQKNDVPEEKKLWNKLGAQVLGGIIMLVVGALFSFLLTARATDYRLMRLEADMKDTRTTVSAVQQDLANGGPQPLAQRVGRLEEAVTAMQGQVNDIWRVTVQNRR